MSSNLPELLAQQQSFFDDQQTRSLPFRKKQLLLLKEALIYEKDTLYKALKKDLHSSEMEFITGEIGFLVAEIERACKQMPRWSKTKRVFTPPVLWPGKSRVHREPLGPVLVIGPWNVPLQLCLLPAVAAIAAGNTVIIKPSEFALETAQVIERLINSRFDASFLHVVSGDASVGAQLASLRFAHIFFTGSQDVGRKVYQAAAVNLCPVTLELGGKNPCVVRQDANIAVAAKRIVFGKFYNAGQTCVAPDTVLVHHSVKQPLMTQLDKTIRKFYSSEPIYSNDYGRIVNDKHFNRIRSLLDKANIYRGGELNAAQRFISPTIVDGVQEDTPLATQEIFGPILPVISYQNDEQLSKLLQRSRTPLALYVFTEDPRAANQLFGRFKAGALVINDTISQVMNPHLPFGGTGTSGLGSYRGDESWRTFTRPVSVFHRSTRIDPQFKYPPYSLEAINVVGRKFKPSK